MITLSDFSLADITPENIKNDPEISALIPALDSEIKQISDAAENLYIISSIDSLSEKTLDFLALQFHIDFYSLAQTLQMKREAVKNSLLWHRKKGTSAAILQALKMIGIDAEFIPWFKSGGQPYTFKIKAEITGDFYRTAGKDKIIESIKKAVNESKAARSLMTDLETFIHFQENSQLHTGFISLLSGHELIKIPHDTPPDQNKIFVINAAFKSGHAIITPFRENLIPHNLYAGNFIFKSVSHSLALDKNIMQDLLLRFENRIFNRLDKYEQSTKDELRKFQLQINQQNEAQNKLILAELEIIRDLLRWKENDDN